ncbi:MAG: zinc ribbon domain-containing protein [bacterium]
MNKKDDNKKKQHAQHDTGGSSDNESDESVQTWSLLGEMKPGHESPEKKPEPPPGITKAEKKMKKCPHCGKDNEDDREFCWACFSPLENQKDRNDHGVIIKKSYLFVPEGGQSNKERPPSPPAQKPEIDFDNPDSGFNRIRTKTGQEIIKTPRRDIQIFKGSHLIAVRIDGKNYTSEDLNIPIEAKMIIRRVQSGESINSILSEIREDKFASGDRQTPRPVFTRGKISILKQIKDNFSTLLIIGFSLILLFQLLFTLRNCG